MAKGNTDLRSAKKAKNDEFYTMLSDIEKELSNYKHHFNGKVVYCNCDDARESNFFKYFVLNFEHLGLKKLICTGYKEEGHGVAKIYEGDKNGNGIVDEDELQVIELEGNGDFRSAECVEFLKEADIVVTNPPFSLFREYIAQLVEFDKKFLVIGNLNAVTYKEIFPLIKENKLWLGATYFNGGAAYFIGDASLYDPKKISNPKNAYIKDGKLYWRVNGVRWFTNLDHNKRHAPIILWKTYNEKEYPKYDNYDAINVNKVSEIPVDYEGVMGVPVSFLDKYNPEQFEIIGGFNGYKESDVENGLICGKETPYLDKDNKVKTWTGPTINKKTVYYRLLIRKIK